MSATKTQTIERVTFGDRLIRLVFWSRRLHRLWFPSAAEVAFIRLMKGRVLTIPFVRSSRDDKPALAIVLSMGYLKRELVDREVRIGRYYADFATPRAAYHKALEIDGRKYHDIVADQQRDDYLHALGWQIMRIPARRVLHEPRVVFVDVCKFLKS